MAYGTSLNRELCDTLWLGKLFFSFIVHSLFHHHIHLILKVNTNHVFCLLTPTYIRKAESGQLLQLKILYATRIGVSGPLGDHRWWRRGTRGKYRESPCMGKEGMAMHQRTNLSHWGLRISPHPLIHRAAATLAHMGQTSWGTWKSRLGHLHLTPLTVHHLADATSNFYAGSYQPDPRTCQLPCVNWLTCLWRRHTACFAHIASLNIWQCHCRIQNEVLHTNCRSRHIGSQWRVLSVWRYRPVCCWQCTCRTCEREDETG